MFSTEIHYEVITFSIGDTKAGTKMGKLQLKNTEDDTILKKEKQQITDEIDELLNKKSGLHGITGLDPDFREIEQASYDEDKPNAKVAINIFSKIEAQFIAKYAVSLRGLDAIVFTGGIGEIRP